MEEAKLSKSQRQQIIFNYLKGKPDPLYEVQETKYGKYIVRPKQIEIEEEEEEPEQTPEEIKPERPETPGPESMDKSQARRERRKRNRRAKQDAKRILDALTNLINSNNGSDDEEIEERRPPPLVEQPNFHPQQLSFKRRRLVL